MGKLGRIACIATPFALSVGSLVCLIIVFMGGLHSSGLSGSLYYFKTDLSHFRSRPVTIAGVNPSSPLISSLIGSATANNLYDFYEIYLFNYCAGKNDSNTQIIQTCSKRTTSFVFNPIDEWGLNGTSVQNEIPKEVNSALNAYTKAAKFMKIAYAVAFGATVGTLIAAIFAICSRWGSCVTSIVSATATLFTILAAVTSTVLFSTIVGAMNTAFKQYQITSTVGTKVMALDWLAVAFSVASSLFWVISICCCSGKSPYNKRADRRTNAADGSGNAFLPFGQNRGYQPLEEGQGQQPYGAPGTHNPMEMQEFGTGPYKGRDTAYEPFRHGNV